MIHQTGETASRDRPRRISEIIDRLLPAGQDGPLSVGDVVDSLHERAFGLGMALFVLPNTPPLPGIPYLSTITGIPVLLMALQLAVGADEPWLPATLTRRTLPRPRLVRGWARVRPWIVRLETLVRPRLPHLTRPTVERLLALLIALHAVILILPIPGANLLPAWAILLLALGILERDGRLVLAGLTVSALSLAWVGVIVVTGEQLYAWFRAQLTAL